MVYSLAPAVFQPADDSAGPGRLNLGCCRIEIPKPE